MEISSNSDLLRYARPGTDLTEDSFLEDFEVIPEGDGDDNARDPIRSCRTPPTETSIGAPVMGNGTKGDVISSLASASSSTGSEETGSQIASMVDLRHCMEENEKLKDRLQEMKQILNEKKSAMTDMMDGFAKACEEDRQKYKNCQELARDAVEKNNELKQQIETLKKQNESLEADKKVHSIPEETDFVNLESLETQVKERNEQIVIQEKKLEDLASHLEHEKAQNADLKIFIRTLEPSQNQKDEIEKLKGEITISQQKINEMISLHSGQEEAIAVLHAQSQSKSDEIENLKGEIRTQQERISRMNTEQLERQEIIENLRAQYESTQTQMMTTDRVVAESDEKLSNTIRYLTEKEAQIKELQEALAEKNQFLEQVNQTLNDRDTEYNSLYRLFTTKSAQVDELSHTIANAEELRQKYQEKIYRFEEELRNSKQMNDHYDKEIRVLKTSVAALNTENESISHWKAQCDAFQADYLTMVSQRDMLDRQILEMNNELTELRERTQKQQDELDELHNTHIRFAQEHINSKPPSEPASTQSDDLLSHVINNFKRGVSILWDGDAAGSGSGDTTTTTGNEVRTSAPENESNQATASIGTSDLPPCPVCGKIFYSYGHLQEHSWDCGKSRISDPSLGSHLDPFVFVPQQ